MACATPEHHWVARPRPKTHPWAAPPAEQRVLAMQLKIGDRLVDTTGEYEVIGHPYTTAAGKNAHVRVRRVDNPDVTMIRTWGVHEHVSVKHATAEEGKR
jgi:hypothetical protein